jgi:signal transduction histidine kinase
LFFLDHQNKINDNKDLDFLNTTLISKAVELELLNKKLQHNKKLLEVYNIELMALAKNDAVQSGDWDRAIDILLIKVATILNVSRVSFWNYNTYSESIVCMAQFTDGEINRNPIELTKKEFPNYFEAIEKEKMIQAEDAFENVYTKDFAETYLKPLNIQSMLDVPYYLDEELGGVLCIEQQINSKSWTTEDVLFARGISDILTIAWKSFQRNTVEQKLFETNKHIEKINQELKQQQEYVYALNQELEAKVEMRTLLLKRQNEKLSEYAFINAHLLRGPLCRIKGLLLQQPMSWIMW